MKGIMIVVLVAFPILVKSPCIDFFKKSYQTCHCRNPFRRSRGNSRGFSCIFGNTDIAKFFCGESFDFYEVKCLFSLVGSRITIPSSPTARHVYERTLSFTNLQTDCLLTLIFQCFNIFSVTLPLTLNGPSFPNNLMPLGLPRYPWYPII
jgi:hypothetical protein